jgi:DNA-binding MarR family transcriptional regulator
MTYTRFMPEITALEPTATEVRWLDDVQQQQWRAYMLGTLALLDKLDRDLKPHDLSLSEYEVLVRLSESANHTIRMADLASSTNQSRSRLTHTISRMERAGLVERVACDEDRRGVNAELTEHGHAVLVEAAPAHVRSVREGLVDVIDPADFAAVGRAFAAVRGNLGCS